MFRRICPPVRVTARSRGIREKFGAFRAADGNGDDNGKAVPRRGIFMEKKNNENGQRQKNEKPAVTRAEKAVRMKVILRELLTERNYRWNEILDASAKIYTEKYPGETEDMNDLKGKLGSVLSLMEDAGEMHFGAGVCSLVKAPEAQPAEEKKQEKKKGEQAEKAPVREKAADAEKPVAAQAPAEAKAADAAPEKAGKPASKAEEGETAEAKPARRRGAGKQSLTAAEGAKPARRGRKPAAKAEKQEGETAEAPEQKPAAEAPVVEESAQKPAEEAEKAEKEAKPARRGRKPKAAKTAVNATADAVAAVADGEKESAEPAKAAAAEEKPQAGKPEMPSAVSAAGQTPEATPAKEEEPAPAVKDEGKEKTKEEGKEEPEKEKAAAPAPEEGKEALKPASESLEKAPLREAEKPAVAVAERHLPAVKAEAKVAPVFDMTLLFGTPVKKETKAERPAGRAPLREGAETKEKQAEKTADKAREKSAEKAAAPAEKVSAPAEKAAERAEKTAAVHIPAGNRDEKKAMPEFAFLGNVSGGAKASAQVRPRELRENRPRDAQAPEQRTAARDPMREPEKTRGQGSDHATNTPAAAPSVQTAPSGQTGNAGGAQANGRRRRGGRQGTAQPLPATPEEALKAEFLKRLRSLGGDYFEYYSVYLLERYSMKNGRRLEGLKVSGGERDGGIDGEIELTDKFGFRETIYIQAKNWDPSKGDLDKWVVGETLLQQFIGAVACRLAKEGKQHSRGIFVTTSHFTPEAKALLETMSDRFIGYDADDVFEAAKECSFGVIRKNGEWALDEALLSGGKAFFNLI